MVKPDLGGEAVILKRGQTHFLIADAENASVPFSRRSTEVLP